MFLVKIAAKRRNFFRAFFAAKRRKFFGGVFQKLPPRFADPGGGSSLLPPRFTDPGGGSKKKLPPPETGGKLDPCFDHLNPK